MASPLNVLLSPIGDSTPTSPFRGRAWVSCCLPLLVSALVGWGVAPLKAEEKLSYNRDVRPILADKCFACHGADSAARKADLRLDRRAEAMDMGAIVPSDLEASSLISRIVTDDHDLLMPPVELKKPLKAEEVELLKRWIAEGAEYEDHWSFITPQRPEPPAIPDSDWPKTAIDHFVLRQLQQRGMTPAPEADPLTLFRRLHLDITGLPPQPKAAQQFVREYQNEGDVALARWIDRLLDRPEWGEHQARYWLDAARYGDTHGLHFDNYREMWPYRDWVIRAFNSNMPFDQFTVEQLAGDLLPNPTQDQLLATGFQRCNITTNEGGTIAEENLALYAADRVQTLGWVYLGLTTNCSQCHDHKFDSFSMKDYYALAAFFRNTTQGAFDGNVPDGKGPVIRVPSLADQPRWNALPSEIAAAKKSRDERGLAAKDDFRSWLATLSAGEVEQSVSDDQLQVHSLLIEGSGSEAMNLVSQTSFKSSGQVTWVPDGKFGPAPVLKLGSNFDLGGLGDFEQTQGFSFGAWIRPATIAGSHSILARMDQEQAFRGWDLWHENGMIGVHLVDRWPESAIKVITRKPVLEAGQWKHVFATYDGSGRPSGVKIYIDGKRQPTIVTSDTLKADASIRTTTPLRIGQRSRDQAFEGAAMQDLRVYGRKLDKSEVLSLATKLPLTALLKSAGSGQPAEQQPALLQYFLANVDAEYQHIEQVIKKLEAEYSEIEKRSPVSHIQREKPDSPPMANILMRGEYDRVGDAVEAATPESLPPMRDGMPKNRLGLAKWIVDERNPLPARVAVNRFWMQIFGNGIVVTPEDFGVSGAMPSHPELLDWLAVEFQESGWNIKQLFRTIFLSSTYRQSSQVTTEKLEKDVDNTWLSRGPRFRMDAEMVRDHALASSGLLAEDMFGPPVKPYQPEGIWDVVGLPGGDTRNYVQSQGKDLYRRSLYTFWKRMAPPPNLEVFNAPSREVCSVRRERTNTPIQALVTLNDPQFVEAARVLAARCMSQSGNAGLDGPIAEHIAWQVLCRPLSISEQSIVLTSKDQFQAYYQAHPEDAQQLLSVGETPVQEGLDLSQLAAWTMVCNQMLNLDEVLNK